MFVLKCAFSCHLNFPTTLSEDVSRKNPSLKFLFCFYFNHLAKGQSTKQLKGHYHQRDAVSRKT